MNIIRCCRLIPVALVCVLSYIQGYGQQSNYINFRSDASANKGVSIKISDGDKIYLGENSISYVGSSDTKTIDYTYSKHISFSSVPLDNSGMEEISSGDSSILIMYDSFSKNIDIQSPIPLEVLSIYDGQGRVVFSDKYKSTINVNQWPKGVYVVVATNSSEYKTIKIFVN